MPTKSQALAGAIVTLLVAILGSSVVEVLKEMQFYALLPGWLKVFTGWLSQIPSSQIFGGIGWAVAVYVLAFYRKEQPQTYDSETTRLYAEIDDFSNGILYANHKAIRCFCEKISKDQSTIWIDGELAGLRRRFIVTIRGHFGCKIVDDPLVRGPLIVDPLNRSGGRMIAIVDQSVAVEVVHGQRARTPTAKESFRSILDQMKDWIRVLSQKPIKSEMISESATI